MKGRRGIIRRPFTFLVSAVSSAATEQESGAGYRSPLPSTGWTIGASKEAVHFDRQIRVGNGGGGRNCRRYPASD